MITQEEQEIADTIQADNGIAKYREPDYSASAESLEESSAYKEAGSPTMLLKNDEPAEGTPTNAEGDNFRVSQTFSPDTVYGKKVKELGSEEAADEYYRPIASQAIKNGKTAEDIDKAIGIKTYKKDSKQVNEQNTNTVDHIVASNSEYNSSLSGTIVDATTSETEEAKARTAKTVQELEQQGFTFDAKTQKLTRDGQTYDMEASFAKVMEAHQAEVMFSILGGFTGGLAGPQGAYALGAAGAYVGNIVDNVKLKGEEDTSVTDEPKTMGESAEEIFTGTRQGIIAASEDVTGARAVELVFKAVGKGYKFFSEPTKQLLQDIKSGNVNTAYDNVIEKSLKTETEIIDETLEILGHTEGGDAIIAKGIDSPEFKQQVITRQLLTNPDLKAELNSVLSDQEAVTKTVELIRKNSEAFKEKFSKGGIETVVDDPNSGITFKNGLDKALQNTLDLLDITNAQIVSGTKYVNLGKDRIQGLVQQAQGALPYLRRHTEDMMNMVGADVRTRHLLDKVETKLTNITDMESLLDFRKSYNELLRQLKVYDGSAYGKTMQGKKANVKAKADSDVALSVKEAVDNMINEAIDASPMTTADKANIKKNWKDGNTLANEVYTTRATELYRTISSSNKNGQQIADAILKSIGQQGGDYASIMSHLEPEQVVKFEENLMQRAIETATDVESGLVDYRTLAKRLDGLKKNTANEETRNAIEVVDTYARLLGNDADIFNYTKQFKEPGGINRGLQTSWVGVAKYIMIGLAKNAFQANYLSLKRFGSKVVPFSEQMGNIAGKIPIVGKAGRSLDKTITDFSTSVATSQNALAGLKKAGSMQEFAAIAEKSGVLPVKLTQAIRSFADDMTNSLQETGVNIDARNEEVAVWLKAKKQADDKAFMEAENLQKQKDSFVRENTPSLIESNEARLATRERVTEAQQNVMNSASDAKAQNMGATDVEVDAVKGIPSQPETKTVTIDGNGNPVSNAGQDAGWGADRNVNQAGRNAEQDLKDTMWNAGIKQPTYEAEIVASQKQLPPSKTIVTPQTEMDGLAMKRDMSPDAAWDRLYQSELPAPTPQGGGSATENLVEGSADYQTKQIRNNVARNFKKYANNINKLKSPKAEPLRMANKNLVNELSKPNPNSQTVKKLYAKVRKEAKGMKYKVPTVASMIKGGTPIKNKAKALMPKDLQKNVYVEDALVNGDIAVKDQVGAMERVNFSGQGKADDGSDMFTPSTDMATDVIPTQLSKQKVTRIRNGKATKEDYLDLRADVEELERQGYDELIADNPFGEVYSATDQIDSFYKAGL